MFLRRTKFTALLFAFLFFIIAAELIYLEIFHHQKSTEKKILFTQKTGLPDLSLSSQESYIRHRSLADVFSIYSNDATLREYSSASFSISNFKEK